MDKLISIRVNGQEINTTHIESVNATVKVINCVFGFDESWDEYPAKVANFKRVNADRGVTVDIIDNKCVVPSEVLLYKGFIEVAIAGTNTDGKVERTKPACIICQTETIVEGDNAIDPTPNQYAQYVEEVGGAINEYFEEHKSEFKGDPGDPGYTPIKGVDYFDGVDGFSPTATVTQSDDGATVRITDKNGTTTAEIKNGENGEDYVLTESDKEEIAGMVETYDDTEIRGEIDDVKKDLSDLNDSVESLDTNKVGFTDFATQSKAGIVIPNNFYGFNVGSTGYLQGAIYPFSGYGGMNESAVISKGTLENVLAERLKEPQFELIEDFTTTEEATTITRTAEPNGTPYSFSKMIIQCDFQNSQAKNRYPCIRLNDRGEGDSIYINGAYTPIFYATYEFDVSNGALIGHARGSNASTTGNAHWSRARFTNPLFAGGKITKMQIMDSVAKNIESGSRIKIYGIRA